ncbi:hypothetical protein B2J89_19460 [Acidovorax sp. SRB_24]|nr:hypothetical protein [Acidovorax sp. SRB_24]
MPFAALVASIFVLLVCMRLKMMQDYSVMLDCGNCLVYPSLWHETQLMLGMLCVDLAARRWLARGAWLVRLLLLACLLIWVLDFWVLKSFLVRLDWREAQKFWRDIDSAGFFLRLFASQALWRVMVSALGVLVVLCVAVGYLRQGRLRHPGWLLPLAGGLFGLSLLFGPEPHFHYVYVRNALAAFIDPSTLYREYSAPWVEQHTPRLRKAAGAKICTAQFVSGPRPVQVVLVVVESLSSYQSQAFGGIHDWTPQLDRWSAKGRRFTHFLANGKTTEDGLFALLTGRPAILQSGRKTVYESDLDPARPTLPQLLYQAGYVTAFMTTGNLAFMQKGVWLEQIGFQTISGHDAPFYDGMPRYHFDAPVDAALYGNARQWMRKQAEQPYFLVLETVSSHQPYFDPIRQKSSIEGAFRYTDAALGDFLDQLEADGFFENGLVIVTGDHRAMVPSSAQERERLGEDHLSRIPLLMLGHSAPAGRERGYFSQQDLLPSLQQQLLRGETCRYPGQGLWNEGHTAAAKCVFTARAQHPDSVFMQCGERVREVRLEAEDTHFVGLQGPTPYLDAIHVQRMPVHLRPPLNEPAVP